MINHTAMQLALRAKLLTLSVCTTGSISMSATATGYARAAGSFLTDGFAPGMEVTPAGFGANAVDVITAVTALSVSVKNARAVEGSASGRTLAVLVPTSIVGENTVFQPIQDVPWLEEQYSPGPSSLESFGASGDVTVEPMYSPRIHVKAGTDFLAAARYADALITLFASSTEMTLSTGEKLFVRADVGPSRGQLMQSEDGFVVVPVNIPLRCYTSNSI